MLSVADFALLVQRIGVNYFYTEATTYLTTPTKNYRMERLVYEVTLELPEASFS
jgi:hypothetical protein